MSNTLPSLLGISVPSTPLLGTLLTYIRKHASPSTVNHSIRSAYFSLLLGSRIPTYTSLPPGTLNLELVFLANIMHDLGWATTKELLSADKRFEVDGANLAVKFIEDHRDVLAGSATHKHAWTKEDTTTLWTSIALHATPSIASHHPSPEVGLASIGIFADFVGPNFPPPFPPGLITKEEYLTIVKAFPREGFYEEVVSVFCGICRWKPETTFDNWQWQFGTIYGLDGKGQGKEGFQKKVSENRQVPMLMGGLEGLKAIEREAGVDFVDKSQGSREGYWYEVV